jgi:two-component system, OmpR family, sensor histidine kinase CiaH
MFQKARIKLTAWYLLIIMMVSMTFSVIIYRVLVGEVERFSQMQRFRIERRLQDSDILPPEWNAHLPVPQFSDPDLVNETKQRIIFALLMINGSIIILSGICGYVLAGRTLKPIADMVDEQNRFISDASHELKTPLTSLKTAFEVFLRDRNQTIAEGKTLITESLMETNKLQSLSESLLALAQYQKNDDGKISFEKLSLDEIIKNAIKKIGPLAKQKKITIRLNSTPTQINGNNYSLTDLMVILLDNAVKYSSSNSVVTVHTEKTNNGVTISVKDQGIGIPKKDIPHIFDRFYRADSARSKSNTNGYGLGLSIAKKIATIHKGTITVQSEVGKGSTFSVYLQH